jgi:hypothetical protein
MLCCLDPVLRLNIKLHSWTLFWNKINLPLASILTREDPVTSWRAKPRGLTRNWSTLLLIRTFNIYNYMDGFTIFVSVLWKNCFPNFFILVKCEIDCWALKCQIRECVNSSRFFLPGFRNELIVRKPVTELSQRQKQDFRNKKSGISSQILQGDRNGCFDMYHYRAFVTKSM